VFYSVLFPRFFGRKKIGLAFLVGAGVALGTSLLGFAFLSGAIYPECVADAEISEVVPFVGVVACCNLLGGTIAFVIKGFSTWFDEREIKEALQEKTHAMELALVKSQLDPHFLFNTINNIDVLILKDATEASEYLNRLSDIMRFMLYETKAERIPLREELAYLEKYIELQKIRTSNKSYVNFTVTGEAEGRMIVPMLFIPFVENAFKHTTNKKAEGAIRIHIVTGEDFISMQCTNRLEPYRAPSVTTGGLGNELIRKRLELLYPGKHRLVTERLADTYQVDLYIKT
jgi:LytS/YehU family sensor histidine kinase